MKFIKLLKQAQISISHTLILFVIILPHFLNVKNSLANDVHDGLVSEVFQFDNTIKVIGSREFIVIEIDPNKWQLLPFHYKEFKMSKCNFKDWKEKLPKVEYIANGGMFHFDKASVGFLKRNGHEIPYSKKSLYKGYYVIGDDVDILNHRNINERKKINQYNNVLQSLMLFNKNKNIRVNKDSIPAQRSFLAINNKNKLIHILTKGAVKLVEMSKWFANNKKLNLKVATYLDGGPLVALKSYNPKILDINSNNDLEEDCKFPIVLALIQK